MGIINFVKRVFSKIPDKEIINLKGNSVIVNLGVRHDDSFGMSDYKRYYKVNNGKVKRKFVKDISSMNNKFKTYELIPLTKSVHIVIIEKYLSKPTPNPILIWNIELNKKSSKEKRLILKIKSKYSLV